MSKKYEIANAKFWVHGANGPVRIKLASGQSLSHCHFEYTDEGWSSEEVMWSFDGEVVQLEAYYSGCDCDGRIDRFYSEYAHRSDLESFVDDSGDEVLRFPVWQRGEYSQRDYSAEAMGY